MRVFRPYPEDWTPQGFAYDPNRGWRLRIITGDEDKEVLVNPLEYGALLTNPLVEYAEILQYGRFEEID
jgi:hypothetical protein